MATATVADPVADPVAAPAPPGRHRPKPRPKPPGRTRAQVASMRASRRHLPERRERFCRIWVETGNGAESAKRAGYEGDVDTRSATACRLLSDAKVQHRIAELMDAAGMVTDPQNVVSFVARVAGTDAERTVDRLRAAELLGKYHAIWQDVHLVRELPRDQVKLRELIEGEVVRVLGRDAILRLAERLRAEPTPAPTPAALPAPAPAPAPAALAVVDVHPEAASDTPETR